MSFSFFPLFSECNAVPSKNFRLRLFKDIVLGESNVRIQAAQLSKAKFLGEAEQRQGVCAWRILQLLLVGNHVLCLRHLGQSKPGYLALRNDELRLVVNSGSVEVVVLTHSI